MMRNIACLVIALNAAFLLTGCDPIYGVMRKADLDSAPPLECVRHAVEAAPGVVSVDNKESHTGKGLFHPTPWVYSYFYHGAPSSNVVGVLQLYKDYEGRFSYKNYLWRMHEPPTQAAIDATRPVMRAIEKNLALQCGITELASGVREDCTGVACNPLPN